MVSEKYKEEDVGRLTPSEKRIKEYYGNSELHTLLYSSRSNGGYLLLYIDRLTVAAKDTHTPPYKYNRLVINKWGKIINRYCGNIWDEEFYDIIDDYSKIER